MATSLTRRAVALATLALSIVVLSACSQSNKGGPDQSGSGKPVQTTAPGGTGALGSAGGPSGPNTSPAPPSYPKDSSAYAKAAVAAWVSGDVSRLDQLEVPGGVLHNLFSCAGCYDKHFVLTDCQGAAGSSYCRFFNNVGDDLMLSLRNEFLGQPRAITNSGWFKPITFPTDTRAYAQEALDAWQLHNDARLKLLTGPAMTSAQISALGADRTAEWVYAGGDGAAGSLYLTWKDPAGNGLVFRFLNGPPAPTTGPTSQHRITSITFQHA